MTRIASSFLCLLSLALLPHAHAQIDDLRMPVIIDAESTDYDGKTSMLEFTGLRLTQGDISIEADTALASRMDFDDSVWQFRGSVVFDLAEGRITCESASLEFRDFTLMRARIEGTPATFRFRRAGSQETTYGEAAQLDYNVPDGLVEFSGSAMINEGGNRISSETLVYNIADQRINAVSGGDGKDRVKVTYMPPEESDEDGATPEEQAPASDTIADEPAQPARQEGDAAPAGASLEAGGTVGESERDDERENGREDDGGGEE
jgi:lipopolysaccharide transport protein LptA